MFVLLTLRIAVLTQRGPFVAKLVCAQLPVRSGPAWPHWGRRGDAAVPLPPGPPTCGPSGVYLRRLGPWEVQTGAGSLSRVLPAFGGPATSRCCPHAMDPAGLAHLSAFLASVTKLSSVEMEALLPEQWVCFSLSRVCRGHHDQFLGLVKREQAAQ